jgi:ribosomal protein S18 acetylase RimI-like enzyme
MTGNFHIQALGPSDLAAYKLLRDVMLARHQDAFTSSAASESRRSAESYLFRLPQANGNGTLFTLCAWAADSAAPAAPGRPATFAASSPLAASGDAVNHGRQMVGAITCERDSRAKVGHIGSIVGMMVRDDMQGQGIGRALLEATLAQARHDRRLEQLILTVTASNSRAVRLYTSAGFQCYGTLPRAIKLDHDQTAAPVYLDKDLMVYPLR